MAYNTCAWCNCYFDEFISVKGRFVPAGYEIRFCSERCYNDWMNAGGPSLTAYKIQNKSDCFITTATCRSRNLPDNCHELETLRAFRDKYMKENESMKADVQEYYKIAPVICRNIDKVKNSNVIYDDIWTNWLKDAVDAVDSGEFEKAYKIYKKMVLELKDKYYEE